MPDLPLPPGVTAKRCEQADCPHELLVRNPTAVRVKHNADGSHTAVPVTPPKARTDPKPRGRRRA